MSAGKFLGHICNICDRTFASLGHLHSHNKFIHFRPYRRRCPVCTRNFRTPLGCRRHISKVHPDYVATSDIENGVKETSGSPTGSSVATESFKAPTTPKGCTKTPGNTTDICKNSSTPTNGYKISGITTDECKTSESIEEECSSVDISTEVCQFLGIPADVDPNNVCNISDSSSDTSDIRMDECEISDDPGEINPIDECQNKITIVTCGICGPLGRRETMVNHYYKEHNINLIKKLIKFNCRKKFFCWKEQVEKKTKSIFVKRFSKLKDRAILSVYRCHRDGHYDSDQGNKNLKSDLPYEPKGCPASIRTIESDGKVEVAFYKTHVGHDCLVERVPLTKKETTERPEEHLPALANIVDKPCHDITVNTHERHLKTHRSKEYFHSLDLLNNCSPKLKPQVNVSKKSESFHSYKSIYLESYDLVKGKVVLKREGFVKGITKRWGRLRPTSPRNNKIKSNDVSSSTNDKQVENEIMTRNINNGDDPRNDSWVVVTDSNEICIVVNSDGEPNANRNSDTSFLVKSDANNTNQKRADSNDYYLSDHCYTIKCNSTNAMNDDSSVLTDNNSNTIDLDSVPISTVDELSSEDVEMELFNFEEENRKQSEQNERVNCYTVNSSGPSSVQDDTTDLDPVPPDDSSSKGAEVGSSFNLQEEKWKELQKMMGIIQSIDSVEALMTFKRNISPLCSALKKVDTSEKQSSPLS